MEIKKTEIRAIRKFADNSEKIEEINNDIKRLIRQQERLQEENEIIILTGKLPVFNSDDIPF